MNLLPNELPEEFGKTVEPLMGDQQLIERFNEETSKSEVNQQMFFNSVIHYMGTCGFSQFGLRAFILNTDLVRNLYVFVHITWQRGVEHGQSDRIVFAPAGSRVYLGCTVSDFFPVTYYTFQIAGERPA